VILSRHCSNDNGNNPKIGAKVQYSVQRLSELPAETVSRRAHQEHEHDERMDAMMPRQSKHEVRSAVIRRRRALSADERESDAQCLLRHVPQITQTSASNTRTPIKTVCAYVPIGAEPGSPAMLDALVDLGLRVLLPVTHADQPLCWGDYRPGELVDAAFGLREPAAPHLEPDAVALAQVILVPALAVDRRGVRLGRGAGFYDRSLQLAAPGVRLVAVVRDDELVDRLPAERHDVQMTHALTPRAGLVALDG
jgi:5-formyltetrahydrofolate cyclo-ligase